MPHRIPLPHRITVTIVWHLVFTRVPLRHLAAHKESERARPHRSPLTLRYKGARRFLVVSFLAFTHLSEQLRPVPFALLSPPFAVRPLPSGEPSRDSPAEVARRSETHAPPSSLAREAIRLPLSLPRLPPSFGSSPNSGE
jgi:hypothetical protein